MPTETLAISAPSISEPTPRYRYRLRFSKTGDLRLVSHHDLMHVLERMMRRAEIPFAVTQGFHPQPKMSFALSLALGVIGRNEVFDLELTRDLPSEELRERLNRVAPAGLSFTTCAVLEKKPNSQVRRMFYRLSLPAYEAGGEGAAARLLRAVGLLEPAETYNPSQPQPETTSHRAAPAARLLGAAGLHESAEEPAHEPQHLGSRLREGQPLTPNPSPRRGEGGQTILDLSQRIESFLALSESWIIRTRPQRRRLNIRPFVDSLTGDSSTLSMVLWVTPQGAARPEEIVGALGLGHLFDDGAVLERTHLELLGEQPEHERFVPDLAAAATAAPASETLNDASPADEPSRAPLPTALVDNPFSFDS